MSLQTDTLLQPLPLLIISVVVAVAVVVVVIVVIVCCGICWPASTVSGQHGQTLQLLHPMCRPGCVSASYSGIIGFDLFIGKISILSFHFYACVQHQAWFPQFRLNLLDLTLVAVIYQFIIVFSVATWHGMSLLSG
ncbi:hypothetical protein Tco_1215257 [Tanacetum coccineum]